MASITMSCRYGGATRATKAMKRGRDGSKVGNVVARLRAWAENGVGDGVRCDLGAGPPAVGLFHTLLVFLEIAAVQIEPLLLGLVLATALKMLISNLRHDVPWIDQGH